MSFKSPLFSNGQSDSQMFPRGLLPNSSIGYVTANEKETGKR